MPKRLLSFLIYILFFIFSINVSAEEKVTLTTYYPAPYGVYDELGSYKLAIGKATPMPTDNGYVNINFPTGTTDKKTAFLQVGGTHDTMFGSAIYAKHIITGIIGEATAASGVGVYGLNNTTKGIGVHGESNSYVGVDGNSNNYYGVRGTGPNGVIGFAKTVGNNQAGYGVFGTSTSSTGVYGVGVIGVEAKSNNTATVDNIGIKASGKDKGVYSESPAGIGVYAKTTSGIGFWLFSTR